MQNAEHKIENPKYTLNQSCNYPSYNFFIDYNGDVLMCSHDWDKKNILGNLNKSSIMEIWMSDNAIKSRLNLSNANRNFSPCDVCDVKGDLIDSNHVLAWQKLK